MFSTLIQGVLVPRALSHTLVLTFFSNTDYLLMQNPHIGEAAPADISFTFFSLVTNRTLSGAWFTYGVPHPVAPQGARYAGGG